MKRDAGRSETDSEPRARLRSRMTLLNPFETKRKKAPSGALSQVCKVQVAEYVTQAPNSLSLSTYDILRGRSIRPGLDRLAEVARVLKVDLEWLIHGIGEVEGPLPFLENSEEAFVAIAHAGVRPSMGGGAIVLDEYEEADRAYHFRKSWIKNGLKASPSQLRIMKVEGDSMEPTLMNGDTVLVDMTRKSPNPPGIFVLDDGIGLVAKRLQHVPNSDPPAVRVISDNKHYPEYERSAEEIVIVGRIRWFAREI